MRIENLLLNSINKSYSDNMFKEGSIFKGEILEILEDLILIDIIGQGVIKATSEIDIKSLVGNEISFLVKSNQDGKMEIKPLIKEEILEQEKTLENNPDYKRNSSISKILNSFNIKETKLSVDLVENLMKYNAPINEKNILEGIKVLEKFIELTSLNNDDKVVSFNNKSINEEKVMENDNLIKEETLEPSKFVTKKTEIEREVSFEKDINLPEKINIKNLLVVDKNSYPEKEDISNLVKAFLGNEGDLEGEEGKEFNKILSFFIKNEMEPSLNNIKHLRELVKRPMNFSKDFEKLNELLDEVKGENNFNKLKELPLNLQLKREDVEEKDVKIKELQELIEKSETKSVLGTNLKKEINELENKIDFLKEMNKDLSFLLLPLNYGKEELDGVLTLLKENKKKNTIDDKINIFINLDTNNLGNIKIFCQAKSETLSIKINIQEDDLKIFQSAEENLINKIGLMGYTVDRIDFVIDEEIDLMDTMTTNPNPNYFLDVKV